MPDNKVRITDMEKFRIPLPGGFNAFGSNQEWYATQWQRLSGCGPSTAANLFYHLALTRPELSALYTDGRPSSKEGMLSIMNDVWAYITPTRGGVNKTSIFAEGAARYGSDRGFQVNCAVLDIPNFYKRKKDKRNEFIEFIYRGIASNCPVAFLNLSNGNLENLHRWHWVTLMDIREENGNFYATASDEGAQKEFDMGLWFETTALGGGLVYFTI